MRSKKIYNISNNQVRDSLSLRLDQVVTDETGNEDIANTILNGLRDYSSACLGNDKAKPFCFYMVCPASQVIAGVFGTTRQYPFSKTLWINGVWVDPAYRGKGLGTKLFAYLDIFASHHKCTSIQCEVFDFQGKTFFEKQGYQVINMIQNALAGRNKYFLRKFSFLSLIDKNFSDVLISYHDEINQIIRKKLNDYSACYFGYYSEKSFSIYIQQNTSKIIGGITGHINRLRTWVNVIWVDANYRGQGIGTLLWKNLEEYVRAENCSLIFVGTLDFQAKAFYEKLGCRCQVKIPSWIDKYDQYYFMKKLLEPSSQAK